MVVNQVYFNIYNNFKYFLSQKNYNKFFPESKKNKVKQVGKAKVAHGRLYNTLQQLCLYTLVQNI